MKKVKITKDNIIGVLTLLIVSFFTIGYGVFYDDLILNGELALGKVGKVLITSVELDTSKTNNTLPSTALSVNEEGNLAINFNTTVSRTETTYTSTYLIHVENQSPYDYTYTGFSINPEVNITNGSDEDAGATIEYSFDTTNSKNTLLVGDTIPPGEPRVAAVILSITVGSENSNIQIEIGGGGSVNSTVENKGELIGTTATKELDLSNGVEKECFDVEVINTFPYRRSFNLSSSNSNFLLVDEDNNDLGDLYIDEPNDTDPTSNHKTYKVCLQVHEGSIFLTDTAKTTILLKSNQLLDYTVGELTVKVDVAEGEVEDDIPPEITDVKFVVDKYNSVIDEESGDDTSYLTANVSWNRQDTTGTNVTNYYIMLYQKASTEDETDTLIQTYETGSDITSYQIVLDKTFLDNETNYENMVTNNSDYYVKVYGIDEALNSGENYCSLNDGNVYCVNSDVTKLKWEFDVITTGLTYMSLSSSSPTKAYLNNTYSATLTPNSYYSLPSSITVTMGEEQLTVNTDYTYSAANSGALNITKGVTGDISLTGTATYSGGVCLVEGTKVRLADGTYKNIEDIKYDDLIIAFSYDIGEIVYEYPIWIERKGTIDHYQKTTFSDGTILETVGTHGVYSKDANRYVSVLDRDNFHVGTNVVKINKNNEIEIVKVKKIEQINKEVNYYHVSSTRYHNIIANDLLTTDAIMIISNMFPFDDDLTWNEERANFLSKNDLFYFKDWMHLFPPHIFKGFRMAEAKYLFNKGQLDIGLFAETLGMLITPPPTNSNNKNIWMVTTSDDLIKGEKGNFYEEGTFYQLKKPIAVIGKEFIGWYNHADNKYYQPYDKVEVDYGMYFKAIWK